MILNKRLTILLLSLPVTLLLAGCNDVKPDPKMIEVQTVANTFLTLRKMEKGKKTNPTKKQLIKKLDKNASLGIAKDAKPNLKLSQGIMDGSIIVNWEFNEDTRTTWLVKQNLDEKDGWVVYLNKGGIQMTETMDKELFEIRFGKGGKK